MSAPFSEQSMPTKFLKRMIISRLWRGSLSALFERAAGDIFIDWQQQNSQLQRELHIRVASTSRLYTL